MSYEGMSRNSCFFFARSSLLVFLYRWVIGAALGGGDATRRPCRFLMDSSPHLLVGVKENKMLNLLLVVFAPDSFLFLLYLLA